MIPREHANLLWIFFLVFSCFGLLMVIIMGISMPFMLSSMFDQIAEDSRRRGGPPVDIGQIKQFFYFGAVALVLINLIFLIPGFVAALLLRSQRRGARVAVIVASIVSLMSIPIGTALGVYGLWFSFSAEGEAYFDGLGAGSPLPPPPQSYH